MMYYRHFGLSGAPFQFTPSPQLLYASPTHAKGLAALERALNQGSAAITLLVGAAGSGKTTLASAMLAREWGRSRVVYLANPKVGGIAMMREVLRQLGIPEQGGYQAMLEEFHCYLASFHANERILILIDEAHHLDDAFCDQIELFLDAKVDGTQRLSLALLGQLELLERIASAKHQRLQEITSSLVVLKPLPKDEGLRYIEYRLAAYDGSRERVFSPNALEYLLEHSVGLPRQINVLCHNAMLLAHSARATRVTLDIARICVSELEGPMHKTDAADSSRNKESAALSNFDELRTPPAKPLTPHKIDVATSGMGIGLLVLGIAIMSALWLFDLRSQQRLRTGLADAEVPAIFNDDWNTSGEMASAEANQVPETYGTEPTTAGSAEGLDADKRTVPEGSKIFNHEPRQVTISRGSSDITAPSVQNSGFGS
jgi:MSHA biogenesis protein MshM